MKRKLSQCIGQDASDNQESTPKRSQRALPLVHRGQDITKAVVKKSRVGLLELPVELRLQIYDYCGLHQDKPINCLNTAPFSTFNTSSKDGVIKRLFIARANDDEIVQKCAWPSRFNKDSKSLLEVCKKINLELSDVIYSGNTFIAKDIPRAVSIENQKRIRKLRLNLTHYGFRSVKGSDSGCELVLGEGPSDGWNYLLQGLTRLEIFVDSRTVQLRDRKPQDILNPRLAGLGKGWDIWFENWMRFLAAKTTKDTKMVVDDAGLPDAHRIIGEWSPTTLTEIREKS